MQQLTLRANGSDHLVRVEPRRTLLGVLRDELGLTGAKKGCDMGNCGACTVLLEGRAVYACLTLAVTCAGREITTIEGLREDSLQRAFVEADALQCGFCTPGQIMSLKALFDADPAPSDGAIVRALSGNLCRCGAYRNIVRAAQLVRSRCAP